MRKAVRQPALGSYFAKLDNSQAILAGQACAGCDASQNLAISATNNLGLCP